MAGNNLIEISANGKWITVPAVDIGGLSLVATGRWIRVAAVHDEAWLERELQDPESCVRTLEKCRSDGLRADIFTFAQKLPTTTPKYRYPMEWDSIAAIRLTSFADWWEKLSQVARKNARRAAKRGVVTTVRPFDDSLVRGIVELNNESPKRQGKPFAHYGKTFEQVKKDHAAFRDRSDFICAHVGQEFVGFLKIVYCDGFGAILQLTTKATHYDKRPANALIVKAVECCEQKGLSFITYGKYRYGNQEMTSLMEFKSRNGFEEIMVPRYYVPLTFKGRIGMALKLHRNLVGILPQSVIAIGRRIRSKWYELRFPQRNKGAASTETI